MGGGAKVFIYSTFLSLRDFQFFSKGGQRSSVGTVPLSGDIPDKIINTCEMEAQQMGMPW